MKLSRREFLTAGAASVSAAAAAAFLNSCSMEKKLPEERSINFGFEDVVTEQSPWEAYGNHMADANVNAVSLSVGRTDWLAFQWPEEPDIQAGLVEDTGTDYVAKALKQLQPFLPEQHHVTLTVDTLLPAWIARDSALSGVTSSGKKSESFAGVWALTQGPVAERLVALVTELCSRYEPDRIALTELMFDDATFGDADARAYQAFADVSDWPRHSDGSIDEGHDSIAQWRSAALSDLAVQLKQAMHSYDTQLDIDVRAPWSDPAGDRAESGHSYAMLLDAADRIVVWNYFGLNNKSPAYGAKITKQLNKSFPGRFTMSNGLWADNDGTISPQDLEKSLTAVANAGAQSVSVSPARLLTADHWNAVSAAWNSA